MALTKIPANLLDKSSHVDFADSERLRFGNNQDFQIYHDGTNSLIDNSTGSLTIDAGVHLFLKAASGESLATFLANGASQLYYDNALKLATTSTGITVNGTATGAFSGTTATASGGTNTTALASTAFVQQELTTLIGGAPSTLNDLNELAAAINDDANYNTTLTTALATKLPLAGGTLTGGLIVQAATGQLRLQGTSNTNKNVSIFYNESGDHGQINVDESGVNQKDLWITGLNLKFGRSTSSESMRINSSGNVGIGTTNPGAPLHTQFSNNDGAIGGALIKNTNTGTTSNFASLSTQAVNGTIQGTFGSAHYPGWGGAVTFAGSQTAHPFKILTGNAVRATFDTGGRLAINQAPAANNFALQVTGLGGASGDARAVYLKGSGAHTSIGGTGPTLVLQNTNSTANNIVKLSFESASSGETVSINAINTNHSSHYGDMAFNTRGSTGYSEKMRIMANGNVGIGTTSPNGRLQFDNGVATRKIVLYEGANNDYQFYGFGVESETLIYSTYLNTDDHVFVSGASSTSRNELMRIEGGGNVGIGTASPANYTYGDLVIDGAGAHSGISLVSNTDGYGGIFFADGTSGSEKYRGYLQYNHNFSGLADKLLFGTGGATNMVLDGSGKLGIGTTGPDSKLHVFNNTNTANNVGSLGFDVSASIGNNATNPGNHYSSGIRIFQGSGSVGSGLGVFNIGVDNGTATTANQYTAQLIAPSGMTGGISLSTGGSERMRIKSDGNVVTTANLTSVNGLHSNNWQLYNTGTNGFLIGTNIATNDYAHIHGEIKLQQFNFSTQQIINFSATVGNAGQVVTSKATADIPVTIQLFAYLNRWYIHVPSPSIYTDISAYIHMGSGYQGTTRSSNAITSLAAGGVPGSGVTNNTPIIASIGVPGSVIQTVYAQSASLVVPSQTNNDYITFISVNITPKYANSKILIAGIAGVEVGGGNYPTVHCRLYRDSTHIKTYLYWGYEGAQTTHRILNEPIHFLDSPTTTSALTYRAKLANSSGSSYTGTYSGKAHGYNPSTIMVQEIAQ